MIKLLFWLAIIGAIVIAGYKIIPIYNTEWKIQDTFDSIANNMPNDSEAMIRSRLGGLFHVKYLSAKDVPNEFYKNIVIKADGSHVEIYSHYHVTVWMLGPVEGVDPDSDYDVADLKGMDKVRNKLRFDFDFEPHAETP